jgi:hypothetical protein
VEASSSAVAAAKVVVSILCHLAMLCGLGLLEKPLLLLLYQYSNTGTSCDLAAGQHVKLLVSLLTGRPCGTSGRCTSRGAAGLAAEQNS